MVEEIGSYTSADLLAMVLQVNGVEPLPEAYITVQDFAAAKGCTKPSARRVLSAMVDNGLLCKRSVLIDKRERLIFYKSEES